MLSTDIVLAASLAVDSFMVSLAIGIKNSAKISRSWICFIALTFGFSQAAMPFFGWQLVTLFYAFIEKVDHWIAFTLLVAIGVNMIRNSFTNEDDNPTTTLRVRTIVTLGIATSIDALAVGFTLPTVSVEPLMTIVIIGIVTTLFSFTALVGTSRIPQSIANPSELIAGFVLIGLGCKILVSHLFL